MIAIFISITIFLKVLSIPNDGNTWVILIAGAYEWENYWSQAQVCADYQQLHASGIPDERIIVWQYDDIANNLKNILHRGKIPWPDNKGKDVYPGCPKDLTKKDVTVENFFKLLKGEDMQVGSGKSLKSTKDDNIFLYFSDHGGDHCAFFPGLNFTFFVNFYLGFKPMHAVDFIDALKFMHENEMYKEMVIYMDTCHSGSMFNGLLNESMNIYAASSSDPLHVAWLCNCLEFPFLNHCFTNCWGQYFIEDTEESMKNGTFNERTLMEQFLDVQKRTETIRQQTSCNYGKMDIASRTLNMFQGAGKESFFKHKINSNNDNAKIEKKMLKLLSLRSEYENTRSIQDKKKLEEYLLHIKKIDLRWKSFAENFKLTVNPQLEDCYPKQVDPYCMKEMINNAIEVCGGFDEYSSQYITLFRQICQKNINTDTVKKFLSEICQ